jgi:hypothetical protein
MEGNELGVGRIDDLVTIIDMNRYIGEAKHGVHERGAVKDAHGTLEVRATRPQSVTNRPTHAVPQFQFANPHRLAAIGIFLDTVLNRQSSRGSVVMGDVPFDSTGNPRTD